MAAHENSTGLTDEWYTPKWVFDALAVEFDLDPCTPDPHIAGALNWRLPSTPARRVIWDGGQFAPWSGSVWLNPPFGGRNGVRPWLKRFIHHGNGIAIVPNRTATAWFQEWAAACEVLLFVHGKIRFVRPDGSEGRSPSFGNVLGAMGEGMSDALTNSGIPGLRFPL